MGLVLRRRERPSAVPGALALAGTGLVESRFMSRSSRSHIFKRRGGGKEVHARGEMGHDQRRHIIYARRCQDESEWLVNHMGRTRTCCWRSTRARCLMRTWALHAACSCPSRSLMRLRREPMVSCDSRWIRSRSWLCSATARRGGCFELEIYPPGPDIDATPIPWPVSRIPC